MLEREMEDAVSLRPDIFIEPRLTFIRRQVVINGRRPDILFKDGLERHLLVELQRGRLDEEHLQRHVYYYFDYLREFPSFHPRLMFIAILLVPQHKEFIDAHGYEYKEIPEGEFQRKIQRLGLTPAVAAPVLETVESERIVTEERSELLADIKKQKMTLSYKMLLLILMAEMADEDGRVSIGSLAERFKEYFVRRRLEGRQQENPNMTGHDRLADRTLGKWASTIRVMPVLHLTNRFLIDEVTSVRWAPAIWEKWSTGLKEEIIITATMRLVEYFNRINESQGHQKPGGGLLP